MLKTLELTQRRAKRRSEWNAVIVASVMLAIGLVIWITKFKGMW